MEVLVLTIVWREDSLALIGLDYTCYPRCVLVGNSSTLRSGLEKDM